MSHNLSYRDLIQELDSISSLIYEKEYTSQEFQAMCNDLFWIIFDSPVTQKASNQYTSLNLIEQKLYLIIITFLSRPRIVEVIRTLGWEASKLYQVLEEDFIILIKSISSLITIQGLLEDEDRKEELVRKVWKTLSLSCENESEEDFNARLTQVDSILLNQIESEIRKKIELALEEARKREAAARSMRE